MVAKRASRASSAAVHAGQPGFVGHTRWGLLISTESDEPTPREERYGGPLNGVYEFVCCTHSRQAVSQESWNFGCVVKAFFSHVTAKKNLKYERVRVRVAAKYDDVVFLLHPHAVPLTE